MSLDELDNPIHELSRDDTLLDNSGDLADCKNCRPLKSKACVMMINSLFEKFNRVDRRWRPLEHSKVADESAQSLD